MDKTIEQRIVDALGPVRSWLWTHDYLEPVAKCMADAILAAVAAEREACAFICDMAERRNLYGNGEETAPEELAAAIRARK